MAIAQDSIVIEASPKECFDIIKDYEAYPEFLKETKSVEVVSKKGQTYQVAYKVKLIKSISYTLETKHKSPKQISWTFVKGDGVMTNSVGNWLFEKTEDGFTNATYTIEEIEFGLFVPGPIKKKLVGSSLPKMLKSFKERIESIVG